MCIDEKTTEPVAALAAAAAAHLPLSVFSDSICSRMRSPTVKRGARSHRRGTSSRWRGKASRKRGMSARKHRKALRKRHKAWRNCKRRGRKATRNLFKPCSGRVRPEGEDTQPCVCTGTQGDEDSDHLFVTCANVECGERFHPACTGMYSRKPEDPMYCAACAAGQPHIARCVAGVSAAAAALRACDLPTTRLSRFMQRKVTGHVRTQRKQGHSDVRCLCVRQLQCQRVAIEIPEPLCQLHGDDPETVAQLQNLRPKPGREPVVVGHQVTVALFQTCLRGMGDVLDFYFEATEFGDGAPPAFRRTIIVDFVDSAGLLQTGAAPAGNGKQRALVYQAALQAYITHRQRDGFRLVLLHACAAQRDKEPLSYLLRRQLPEPRKMCAQHPAGEAAQFNLLRWYQHLVRPLRARGTVETPPPRAEPVCPFLKGEGELSRVQQLLWEEADTLGRWAEEQLGTGDCSLRGVPIVMTSLADDTLDAVEAARSNARAGGGGPRGNEREAESEQPPPLTPVEALHAWTAAQETQFDYVILRLRGHTEAEASSVPPAGCRGSATPVSDISEVNKLPKQELFAVWGKGQPCYELLGDYHLRFDTHELAVHATRQLLLWMRPAGRARSAEL